LHEDRHFPQFVDAGDEDLVGNRSLEHHATATAAGKSGHWLLRRQQEGSRSQVNTHTAGC
jgi:hypothetical protein